MRSLVLHGIVRSIRGVEGGYILAKPVCDISLLHVIEATGSDISPEMPDVEAMPTNTKHRLSAILKGINAGTVKHLASVSLADLGAAPTKLNLGELAGGFVPIDTPTETGS